MTVVVGVDGSVGAERALAWAVEEARWRRARLEVVHAWTRGLGGHAATASSLGLLEEASQALLDRQVAFARTIGPGLEIEGVLLLEPAAVALVQLSEHSELVVVGSRGHGELASLLLGSVADACVRHARSPVAVIRERPSDGTLPVVVGVNGSAASTRALCWAANEARLRNARLVVVHAWTPLFVGELTSVSSTPDADAAIERAAAETLTRAADHVGAPGAGPKPEPELVRGDAADALLDAATRASLLVVGSRGRSAVAGLVLGSVSTRCVHEAPCPVVVVRDV